MDYINGHLNYLSHFARTKMDSFIVFILFTLITCVLVEITIILKIKKLDLWKVYGSVAVILFVDSVIFGVYDIHDYLTYRDNYIKAQNCLEFEIAYNRAKVTYFNEEGIVVKDEIGIREKNRNRCCYL